jgi:O-antigen ligase/tetratricopeptide (TPR) repeat protein
VTRALVVAALMAVATLGEGGAAAGSLVVQHVLLALAIAAVVLVVPPSSHVPAKAPALAWLAFAALAAAGAATAPYAYAAWLVMVEIVAFGALAWMAAGDPAAWRRIVPPAIAVVAAAHGVHAIVQELGGALRPASTFLNPSHLAAWSAAAALVLAGAAYDPAAGRRARWAFGVAATLALAALFVAGSRGAALGFVVGTPALVAISWGSIPARGRRGLLAAAGLMAIVAVLGVASRFRTDDDPYRFLRTRIWASSARLLAASPSRGTGPGQFAAAAAGVNFPLETTALRFERGFRTPHSDVLRAVCEFGIPAGLAAFTAVGLLGAGILRRRRDLTPVERGAAAALVALGAQAFVDDLSVRPALLTLGAALAGPLLATPRAGLPSAATRAAGRATAILLVLALGVAELAAYRGWSLMHVLPRGRLDDGQLARLRSSLAWNPMAADTWARLAEHHTGDGKSWDLDGYSVAREASERAVRLQPSDAVYQRGAARVEASACLSITPFVASRERAAGLYEAAAERAPTDATIPLEETIFLVRAGDPAGARRAAERAVRLEPKAPVPRLWLAEAILAGKGASGADEARRLLGEALALAPPPGSTPVSPYDASLRWADAKLVERLQRILR